MKVSVVRSETSEVADVYGVVPNRENCSFTGRAGSVDGVTTEISLSSSILCRIRSCMDYRTWWLEWV